MEGERFSSFACNFLTKRPRLSSQNSQRNALNDSSTSYDDIDRENSINEPSDEELLWWQERQIAKCIVDNTVNRVVESYLTFFEDEDINGDDVIDFQDPVLPRFNPINDRLEESAILWAIDEHGLQQHDEQLSTDHSETVSVSSSPRTTIATNTVVRQSPVEEESSMSTIDFCNEDSDSDDAPPINDDDKKGAASSEMPNSETARGTSSSNGETYENHTNESEHFDFMEAAVAVAIQKKGLTPYSIQMSPNR